MRNEVAHLKQLLLAHKDCPVTNMQKKTAYLGGLPLLLPSSYSYSTQMNVLVVALSVSTCCMVQNSHPFISFSVVVQK